MDDDQKKCGGITVLGLIVLALSTAMIVIGCINLDFETSSLENPENLASTCSAQPKIPYYLLVAGIMNIVLMACRAIFQRMCRKCGECGDDSSCCTTLNFACKFSCIAFFDIIAWTIITIWLCVGTAWVMGIYKNVRFDGQHVLSNYCPEYLYQFSFSMVIISWIFVVVAGTFGVAAKLCQCFWTLLCCKPCKDAEANRA